MTPTPEQTKAAHEQCGMLRRMGMEVTAEMLEAALPPLPEPQPPRLTPVTEFLGCSHVRARDAEIVAWCEWKRHEYVSNGWHGAAADLSHLIAQIKEAGK